MKHIISLLTIAIVTIITTSQNTCKVFKCGTIDQSDQPKSVTLCVFANHPKQNAHIIQSCSANDTCAAHTWTFPGQAANKTCFPNTDPVFTIDTRLAGETCLQDENCYNYDKGAFCDKNNTEVEFGACATSIKLGDDCGRQDHKKCPAQSYCSKDKKCVSALQLGQECDQNNFCEFGLICVASDEKLQKHTCHQVGFLEANSTFAFEDITDIDEYFGPQSICFQHTFNDTAKTNIKKCTKGDISKDRNIDDLRRETADEMWEFTTFHGFNNISEEGLSRQEPAECGFNKDSKAWCRKRKGDRWFTRVFDEFRATDFSKMNCHVESNAEECLDAFYLTGKDIFTKFKNSLYEVNGNTGFARIANNDLCVAESITSSFWQGRDPDSAIAFGTLSVVILGAISCLWMI